MFAMWSFKEKLGVGFIAGTLLDPESPVTKMSGPWNRNLMKSKYTLGLNKPKIFQVGGK